MKSRRFFQILKPVLLLGMAGLVYGIFVRYTGLAIPCFFNKVTGLYCPGCGVTRMCVALLQFHFREAFYANPVILCMLPVFLLVFLTGAVRYVKDGVRELPRWQNIVLYICIGILVLFGILRNLPFPPFNG